MLEEPISDTAPEVIFQPTYKNIGWSLGNVCPMRCQQCYSRVTRTGDATLTEPVIDHIIRQMSDLGVESINLGGNEPIYTNGSTESVSLLPTIIDKIADKNIRIGITSAGPTLEILDKMYPDQLKKLNDVDISLDSPIASEHDRNRGRSGMFESAVAALKICDKYAIPKSIIICAMKWNFTPDRIDALIDLAIKYGANIRINPLQPIEKKQFLQVLSPEQYYEGLYQILERCDPIELGDPLWSVASGTSKAEGKGCPCGVSSFRIHSITPDGEIPVSPCVYLHDFKYGDLAKMGIREILASKPFQAFLWRKAHSTKLRSCAGCNHVEQCRGGCAARSYLFEKHLHGIGSILQKDPYCLNALEDKPKPQKRVLQIAEDIHGLVHANYLCTGIFYPIK